MELRLKVNYLVTFTLLVKMDLSDEYISNNRDWDPSYLCNQDFYEFSDMWCSNITDMEIVKETEKVETYCPITEDISMDDTVLCSAVKKIEKE